MKIANNIAPTALTMPTVESEHDEYNQLYQRVEDKALEIIDWYLKRKTIQAMGSRILRILAIFFTIVGGVMPLLQGLLLENLSSQLGYIALALAAACVGADKFFGFSSGWMRYMLTQLSLQKALAEFQLGWMLLWADIDKQQPTPEQRKKILQYLIDFQAKLFTEINQETQTWMIEFQSNLIQLERSTRTQSQLQRLLDSKKKVD